MFSFLNPALLWALPLATVPVLLHLVFLRRARKLPFSDLTLLRAAYLRSLPATRLRQWLLMAVRCLMIASLILAFARPMLHRAQAAGGAKQALDVVLLLDASWSMKARARGKTVFDWAKAAGAELIGALRPGDRVATAAFSRDIEGELGWAADKDAARAALARMRAGNRSGDIGPALASAYRFLSSGEKNARRCVIVILSDNAAHLFKALPASGVQGLPGFDSRALLLGLGWLETLENAGVFEVHPSAGDSAARAGGLGQDEAGLWARAALYGGARESSLDLWLRDRRAEQRTLRLGPGLGPPLYFRLPSSSAPDLWGRLEMRRDALPEDDAYYFSLRVQPWPRALLLYGDSSALEAGKSGYFLKQLLGEGGRLPYRLDAADLGRMDQIRLEDYGAVILADLRPMPAGAAAAIARYVVHGGGLWVMAGSRLEEKSYRDLSPLLPGTLGPAMDAPGSGFRAQTAEFPPSSGPSAFSWSDFELQNIAVNRRYPLAPASGARVWFRDGAGRPLLAAGTYGSGRVLLWASSLDIAWTNLALKPAFAAWVDAGLRYLSGYTGEQAWRTLVVDQPILRVWEPGELAPTRVLVSGPGGRRTELLVRGRKVEYRDTGEPGFYFLSSAESGRTQSEVYAVNLDRADSEGDLTPISRPPWRTLRPDALREDFLRVVYGREARTAALALFALLALLEALLARPRARAQEPAREAA